MTFTCMLGYQAGPHHIAFADLLLELHSCPAHCSRCSEGAFIADSLRYRPLSPCSAHPLLPSHTPDKCLQAQGLGRVVQHTAAPCS